MHHPVVYGNSSSPATGPFFAATANRCRGGCRRRASSAAAAAATLLFAIASSASCCALRFGARLFYAELRQLRGDDIFWAWRRSERLVGMIFASDTASVGVSGRLSEERETPGRIYGPSTFHVTCHTSCWDSMLVVQEQLNILFGFCTELCRWLTWILNRF